MGSSENMFSNIPGQKPPPDDFVGYENLIAFMQERDLSRLEGDLVEIGAFMGGGTVKLASFAQKFNSNKRKCK